MTVLYCFFDESGKKRDHPLVAICCVCAPLSKLEKFENDWHKLLASYELHDFHMMRAVEYNRSWGNVPKQSLEERTEAIKPFADCIGQLEYGLIQAWDVKGFEAIHPLARTKLGNPNDPFYLAFVRAALALADYVREGDVASFVCDFDEETAWNTYCHYRGIRRVSSKIKRKTGCVAFADDKFFPALQAADMVAYLTRWEARDEFYRIHNKWVSLFNYLTRENNPSGMQWNKMFADQSKAKNLLRSALGIATSE